MKIAFRRCLAATTLVPLTMLTSTVWAQPDGIFTEEDLFGGIPVVSAVSRFEQRLERAPASVTIISRELIDMSGAQSFVDIFRLVPGFQSYSASNNRFGISYHGIGREFPNQIEVMVDGRSVYETLFSSVNWTTLGIGLDDIDHIEVVRGSNAPAQGSNAFLGAVNIITRKPVQEEGVSVKVTTGDLQTRRASIINSGRVGEVDVRLSLGYDKNNGFPAVPDGPIQDGHELSYGNLRGIYTPTIADTLDVFAGYSHDRLGWGDSDHPGEYSLAHTFASFQSLNWTHTHNSRNEFQLHGYHNSFETSDLSGIGPLYALLGIDDDTADFLTAVTPAPAEIVDLFSRLSGLDTAPATAVLNELNTLIYGGFGKLASERYDLGFQHNYAIIDTFRGTWGVGIRYDSLTTDHPQSYSQDIDEVSPRLYNHNEWQPRHNLTFNLGYMVEVAPVGMLVSPRVSVNFQPLNNHAFRIAYARGNRAPSLLEAHEQNVARVGDVIFDTYRIADPNLGEETIDSYEIAYMYQSNNPGLSVDIRLFREEIRDVIDEARERAPPEVEIFGDGYYKILGNWDYWEFNGGEIQINYQLSPATFARLHYSSLDFDAEIAPPRAGFLPVFKNDRVARHSGGLLIEHTLTPRLSVALTGYYQSELRWEDGDTFDAITRIDAQVSYRFNLGSAAGKIRLVAQNLGDDYSEFNDNNVFGTRFFISAEMDFPD